MPKLWDPETTPNFSVEGDPKLACSCGVCGWQVNILQSTMDKVQALRTFVGPIRITSGFRCPNHPEERKKPKPGAHAQGLAVDIAVENSGQRYKIIAKAIELGFVGVGVGKNFLHLDAGHATAPRPAVWTY